MGQPTLTLTIKSDASQGVAGAKAASAAFDEAAQSAAKVTQATDGATRSMAELEKQSDSTANAGEKIGLILAGALTAAAAGFGALTAKAITSLSDIYTESQKLGTSVEFLSTIGVAARQNDLAIGPLNDHLNLFSSNLAKAAGGAKIQSQLFVDMGLSVLDATGHVKSLEEILPEIADKFATYRDGPTKAALANKLFGESGSDLIPLLNELGDEGFAKVRDAAAQMGLVIDSNTAKAAHQLNDEITALKLTTSAYFDKVARDVLPNLILFAQSLNDQAKAASDANDKTTVLGNGIRGLATWLIEAYGEAQRFGVGLGSALAEADLDLEKIKAKYSDPGYVGLVGQALLGNGEAVAALKAFNGVVDAQFAPKLQALRSAADASFADIDKNVAAHVAAINRNVDSLGSNAATAGNRIRTGNAPFAEYNLGGRSSSLQADNDLQSLSNFADSLTDKVGGPLAQAWQKYSDQLTRADELAEKAVIAGANINSVIEQQNRAYDNANRLLEKNITDIVLRQEKQQTAGWDKDAAAIADYNLTLGDQTDLIDAQIAAGGSLNAVEQAQYDLKQKLRGASQAEIDLLKADTQGTLTNAAAKDKANAALDLEKTILDGLGSLIDETRQGVIGGANAFDALGSAAARVLPSIAKQFEDILGKLDGAKEGTADFNKLISGLGDNLQKELPALGELAGTVIGGGGQGAQAGSALGSLVGGIVGSIVPAIGTAIGAAIGGVLGGLVGGLVGSSGSKQPAIYGSSIPGSVGRNGTAAITDPLGIFASDTNNLANDAYQGFEAQVKQFDISLAHLFDPAQLDKVKAALDHFSGKFSDINSLLTARFAVILGTFDDNIKNFVTNFAGDLQDQVQALADVLQLQKLDKAGQLITDNFDDALTLISEFAQAGERVSDTYQRIVTSTDDYKEALSLLGTSFDGDKTKLAEFAQNISDAVGSTQAADALWQQFFKSFFSTAQINTANVVSLQQKATTSLTSLGLSSTISLNDFKQKFLAALPTLTPDQVANWLQAGAALGALNDAINGLITQGEQLVDELFGGGTLSDVNSQIAALEAKANTTSAPLRQVGSAITSLAQTATSAANLMLGALSPLNDQQKLQYALNGLRNGSVTPDQVLQIGRNLYASSQAYTDLFNMVTNIAKHVGVQGASGGSFSSAGTTSSTGVLSQADQDKLNGLLGRQATLQAQQTKQEANDLATTVAQLALTQKESFKQVADELGFNLDDLAKALGIKDDDLTTYLTNIQAQQNAIPDAVTAGSDNVVRALYDIAGKPLPSWATATTVGSGSVVIDGHSTRIASGRNFSIGNTANVSAPANLHLAAANEGNAVLRQIRDIGQRTLDAVNRNVDATQRVGNAFRNPSNPRRSARAAM